MPRITFNGEPGETWQNDTERVAYQLVVNWHNSCGLCCQFDHAVGPSWPIPFHRGCRCKQLLIRPGAESQPFVDFKDKIESLDPAQQTRVVGRSNLTLIEKGVVSWSDVVTSNRVRDFREVVARAKLTVKDMVGAGVQPRQARDAYSAVHTPAHQLAEAKRQDLLGKLLAKGIERDQIKQALAERLAARVGIAAGPSGPGAAPVVPIVPRPTGGAGGVPLVVPAIPVPRRISARRPAARRPAISAKGSGPAFAPPVQQAYLESLGVRPEVARPASPTAPVLPGRPIGERIAGWDDGHEKVKQLQEIGSDYARLRAEKDARRAELEAAITDHAALRAGPEKRAALAAKKTATTAYDKAHIAFLREERSVRERAQDILKAPGRLDVGLYPSSAEKLSDEQFGNVAEGMRWMQRNMVNPEGAQETLRVNAIPVPAGLAQRSACGRAFMWLAQGVGPATFVHEMGHHFDYQVSGFREVSTEFLTHRVGDEPLTPLNEVIKDRGKFDEDELGRKDKFDEAFGDTGWYAGKHYEDGSTEITAMGLEQMFRDPVGFAQADPEYAAFILGLMHGALR